MPALAASSAPGGPVSKVAGQASSLLHAAMACAPGTCSLKSQVAELGLTEFKPCFGTAYVPGKGQKPRARGGQGSQPRGCRGFQSFIL